MRGVDRYLHIRFQPSHFFLFVLPSVLHVWWSSLTSMFTLVQTEGQRLHCRTDWWHLNILSFTQSWVYHIFLEEGEMTSCKIGWNERINTRCLPKIYIVDHSTSIKEKIYSKREFWHRAERWKMDLLYRIENPFRENRVPVFCHSCMFIFFQFILCALSYTIYIRL